MPLTRSLLQDIGMNAYNRRTTYVVPPYIQNPISATNQTVPDNSIDFTKTTIDKLYVNQSISSSNYVTGAIGWIINGDGNAEFSNVTVRGTIYATLGQIGGWNIDATRIYSTNIDIDSDNEWIRSTNYVSGAFGQGFSLSKDLLEVGNIAARGTIRTANFQKDVISSIAGGQVISPNSATLGEDVASGDTTLTINGDSTLALYDIIRMKEGNQDESMIVFNTDSAPTYSVLRRANDLVEVASLDSLTADGGTWVGTSGGVNAATDTSGMKQGAGCVQVDFDGSTTYQSIRSVITSTDISSFIGTSYAYGWIYIPDLTGFNLPGLAFTTDPGGYSNYIVVGGTTADGGAWKVGWNLAKYDFTYNFYNDTGNIVDISAITGIALFAFGAITANGYKFDSVMLLNTRTQETNRTHYWELNGAGSAYQADRGYNDVLCPGTVIDGAWSGSNLVFNGTTTYVDIPGDASLNSASFSISMWVNPDQWRIQGLANKGDGTGAWRLFMSSVGGGVEFDGQPGEIGNIGTGALTVGAWSHIVATFDNATSTANIYLNGVLQQTATSVTYDNTQPTNLYLGGSIGATWDGMIKACKFYNSALTQPQVTSLYTTNYAAGFVAIPDDAWTKGAAVIDYGQNGQGIIYNTASASDSPYQDILTHTGTPWDEDTNTTQVRVGNLAGISDSDFGGALSGYGIYTQNGYFKGTVDVGVSGAVKGGQTAYATGNGFFLGYESGVYKQSIGNASQYLKYDGTNLFFSGAMVLNAPLSLPPYTVATLPVPPTTVGPDSPSSNAY